MDVDGCMNGLFRIGGQRDGCMYEDVCMGEDGWVDDDVCIG